MSAGAGAVGETKKTIKLFCPSLSKAVQLVAPEEQKLDLGSIARTFGLDPSTLKLNGHFISRGVDLIASSVTWKSLISFFSSRGLSTGTNGSGALVVDGKLSKSGSKRLHDSEVTEIGIASTSDQGNNGINRKPLIDDISYLGKKKRFKCLDLDGECDKSVTSNAFSLKRKQEDAVSSPLKRIKLDETENNSSCQRREYTCSETLSKARCPCSFLGLNMKRMREDEMAVPDSCKKIR